MFQNQLYIKNIMLGSDKMKLIVGLGNPGCDYDNTRHNVGFFMLDLYAKSRGVTIDKKKFNGYYVDFLINDEKIILLKPLSYMNLSGTVIRDYVDFYKIPVDDILVIHDDLDLKLGNFKLKETGSSGGHNGLKNVEMQLATKNYKRLKIGISNDKRIETKDYVLGKFSKEEKVILEQLSKTVINIIDDSVEYPFSSLMNKYNQKNR